MAIAKRVLRFLRQTEGSATVEFVLWVPIFVLIMGVVVDVSTAMTMQSRYYDIARDASRQVALGITDTSTAKASAKTAVGTSSASVSVTEDATYVTTTITVPYSDVVMFYSAIPATGNLVASVSMYREASVSAGG